MRTKIPRLCHHKPTGQARVRVRGRDHYLGAYGSDEAKARYDELIAGWLASGRRDVDSDQDGPRTVDDLIATYGRHLEETQGLQAIERLRFALRPLHRLFGSEPIREFGPRKLIRIQTLLARKELCRVTVNDRVQAIRRVFKWAVAREYAPRDLYHALLAVEGLRAGHSTAKESRPVPPVRWEHVEATLEHLTAPVRAIVLIGWWTGARPGEVCAMTTGAIDREGEIWWYRPLSHKNTWRGKSRAIALGPQSQKVLRPFLKIDRDVPLFDPRESVRESRRRGARGSRRDGQPDSKRTSDRKVGDRYDTCALRHAIERACKKAGVPVWRPNQLRHAAATRIRREHGIEAARLLLGHGSAFVTAGAYVEIEQLRLKDVATKSS